jgi:DNA-binding transcriptional MerR regulator
MNRSISQVADILGVDSQQVKTWVGLFKEHLSPQANPEKGQPRSFTDSDVLVLTHVTMHWEEDPDLEEIKMGLNHEDHYNDAYRDILYRNTPILQEAPDDHDETWRHGILLNGGDVGERLTLARSYKQSADSLLELALQIREPRDLGYPVLYAYRHSLELYLKLIGEIEEYIHELNDCIKRVEKRYGRRISSPIREWIIEFDKIDPKGTAFRYADDQARTLTYADFWVDLVQLKFAMRRVFQTLDHAVLWPKVGLVSATKE